MTNLRELAADLCYTVVKTTAKSTLFPVRLDLPESVKETLPRATTKAIEGIRVLLLLFGVLSDQFQSLILLTAFLSNLHGAYDRWMAGITFLGTLISSTSRPSFSDRFGGRR